MGHFQISFNFKCVGWFVLQLNILYLVHFIQYVSFKQTILYSIIIILVLNDCFTQIARLCKFVRFCAKLGIEL